MNNKAKAALKLSVVISDLRGKIQRDADDKKALIARAERAEAEAARLALKIKGRARI